MTARLDAAALSQLIVDARTQNKWQARDVPDALLKEIDELLLAARHKPRNPNSEAHKKFIRKNLDKLEKFEKELGLNFEEEKKALMSYL